MATLYEIQPDREPLEFTHFDCWFSDDDTDEENGEGLDLFHEASDKDLARVMDRILTSWEKSLGLELPRPNVTAVGVDYALDIVLMTIMEHGYNIFKGSDFIEIYKGEEL